MDPTDLTEKPQLQTAELDKAVETDEKRQLDRSESDVVSEKLPPSPPSTSSRSSENEKTAAKSKYKWKRNSKNKPAVKSKDDKGAEEEAWAHLPEHERDIIRRQLHVPEASVSYFTLFRYATTLDKVILLVSAICAIIAGAVLPLMTVVFGSLSGNFAGFYSGTINYDDFKSQLNQFTLYFVYIAIGEFVTVYINTVGFIYVGEHITAKIREHYLEAIMKQNIGFFDKLGAGEITTRITADTNQVQEGISEKVGLTLTAIATFIAAFVIGFIEYWKLTLILCSVVVAIVLSMGIGSNWIVKYEKRTVASFAEGGTVAEEVLSSIRNAVAFGTEDKLAKQYEKHLSVASFWGQRNKMIMAVLWASILWIMYQSYALAFWMGSRFIVDGSTTLSKVVTVNFAIIIGSFNLGNIAPNAQAFTSAAAAAAKIFNTIDRVSPLDPSQDVGEKLDHVEGTIELRNIKHIYPSRADVVVMDDVNLVVPSGKTTALVGASGSGKSTIVGLVERFYNPVGGQVLLDGHDVQKLSLKWLRQQISLVSQEPTLFSVTIYENIRHGLIGTKFEHASAEEQKAMIEKAAKMANAHSFITELPEGYETNVGARGFLLSGGQKQRIAIARAMVSDPKILLLDEATSALDTKSEGVVQAALDVAAKGRTTIVIAHRLSTIRDADNIVVMSQGRIVEQGTHNELLAKSGSYFRLVEAQRISAQRAQEEAERVAELEEEDEKIFQTVSRQKSKDYISDPEDENLKTKLDRTVSGQSVSSRELKNRPQEGEPKYTLWRLIKITASFNKPERAWMLFGLFWAIIAGGGNPTQSVFFAEMILSLSVPPPYPGLRKNVDFWSWMFFMLAWVQLLSMSLQGIALAFCSQKLIFRARSKAFRAMLRQDITFFDRDENSAGALTSFLSTETNHLAGLSGSTLGTILLTSTTLIAGMVVGLSLAWKLALVCIACIPLMVGAGFFRFWLLARFQSRAKKAYEASASYACEATSAIRTVASLTREQDVWNQYHESLDAQQKKSLSSVAKSSLLYAASQSIMFLVMALGFWFGGNRLATGEIGILQFFIAFSSIVFGAQSAGTIFSFAPDMGKAKHAAEGLKTLLDRKPEIDTWSGEGNSVPDVEGTIEFRDVHFRYPTRPEQPVLRGLNLTVKPGQYVALVGASGCGKSTTIALLERFYDPLSGGVFIDGKDIATLNVNEYRKHLSLVSQEPTLYQGTVKENILLGSTGDDASITDERVERACREANIYDFVMSLPDGFNTVVGSKGSLLSGGQKQRIAIARALLRDPKILLLDEATSALDSESEKVVQAALDAAAKGRTTIAVAHRLSTIQKADMIYVFDQGRIVENGTHEELLKINGKYAELVNLQSLEKKN